jgi:hypothetical protein
MTNYDRVYLQDAMLRWKKIINPNAKRLEAGDITAFAHAIGQAHNLYKTNTCKVIDTNEKAVRDLIDLINGPNGHTILKMLIARNEDVRE